MPDDNRNGTIANGDIPVQLSLGEVSFMRSESHDGTALEERLALPGFSLLEDKKIKNDKKNKTTG